MIMHHDASDTHHIADRPHAPQQCRDFLCAARGLGARALHREAERGDEGGGAHMHARELERQLSGE